MAKKVSKRKLPSKDEYLIKERSKIESEVFDRSTLVALAKIMKKGIFKTVDYPISTGKEANVFRATTEEGNYVAIKIYKIETASFLRRLPYLEGDPRFKKIKKDERTLVSLFARKEFKNLEICAKVGINAPRPIFLLQNIVVMEFLGENGLPYPRMDLVGPLHGEDDLKSLLNDIKKMYKGGFVHADISEYNILMGNKPYLIDFGQGVVLGHPKAEEFLQRDVRNILRYFSKFGYSYDIQKIINWIKH
ncbi:MAG: serine protein kinase RIO [Candidatus Bilamarchaeaceae archaeon]